MQRCEIRHSGSLGEVRQKHSKYCKPKIFLRKIGGGGNCQRVYMYLLWHGLPRRLPRLIDGQGRQTLMRKCREDMRIPDVSKALHLASKALCWRIWRCLHCNNSITSTLSEYDGSWARGAAVHVPGHVPLKIPERAEHLIIAVLAK